MSRVPPILLFVVFGEEIGHESGVYPWEFELYVLWLK